MAKMARFWPFMAKIAPFWPWWEVKKIKHAKPAKQWSTPCLLFPLSKLIKTWSKLDQTWSKLNKLDWNFNYNTRNFNEKNFFSTGTDIVERQLWSPNIRFHFKFHFHFFRLKPSHTRKIWENRRFFGSLMDTQNIDFECILIIFKEGVERFSLL